MTTVELRRKLKILGYTLKLKTSSLGLYANVIHESGQSHGSVCFDDTVGRWDAFNKFVDENKNELLEWQKETGVFGVKAWFTKPTVI